MAEPLARHPAFTRLASVAVQHPPVSAAASFHCSIPLNLVAYDGRGQLFLWNYSERVLYSVEIEQSDTSVATQKTLFAKSIYKTLQLTLDVEFLVQCLLFNRRGCSLLLVGNNGLVLVDITSQVPTSHMEDSAFVVRATNVGVDIFGGSSKALRILQVAWHPYSDTHIGVLSSDGVFWLFDLSLSVQSPEQEYHVQSQIIKTSSPPIYTRPVAFSFGGEHLWDRLAVFLLFSNGSIYALCPVCPFGSLYNSSVIEELYRDACQWTSSNTNSKAATNASLASTWLETVFPSLAVQPGESVPLVLKALAHVPFNASPLLQGPFPVIMGGNASGNKSSSAASILMYNVVGKDSILAVSFKDGQMQVYALADELQPVWNEGISPRLQFSEEGYLMSAAMLVDTVGDMHCIFGKDEITKDGQLQDTVWVGQVPPLLQLAVVDFALPGSVLELSPLAILADPIVPERLYCYHGAGIDAILLQWLPFSEQSMDKCLPGKPPIVYPILDTCQSQKLRHLLLVGVAQILDFCGEVWLVAVTTSYECIVIQMKSHGHFDHLHVSNYIDIDQDALDSEGSGVSQVISKDLLQGPKDIPISLVSSTGRCLTSDSVEGRAFLHDQYKLLHEKYIEYAHRVYVELKSHGHRLQSIVEEQHTRLSEVQDKVEEAFQLSSSLTSRIEGAFDKNKILKDRLRRYGSHLAITQKPLTAAEQEYRSQLDVMQHHDLYILHNAVDVLREQFERQLSVSEKGYKQKPYYQIGRVHVPDSQMNKLKVAVIQLTQLVETTLNQVNIVEDLVRKRELLCS